MKTTTWSIDPMHSEIQFKVKHLVITTVTGRFNDFSGTIHADENFENADITFEINAASISTSNDQRDTHLKSADFFNVETYPKISFRGESLRKTHDGEYQLTGDITIKETTLPIALSVDYAGTVTDPWGNIKAGFEVRGSLNRKNFGLTWNATTETGGLVVSEDVKLAINLQLVKQAERVAA
jgi:polyisoprenoid-binding protein YceI